MTVGTTPTAITVGANGSVYVADSGANTVTAIDPHTLATTTIATGINPDSIAIGSNGNLYVTNGGSDSLDVVNVQNYSATTISVGVDTNTVTVNSDGSLRVTNNYDNTVSVISTITGTDYRQRRNHHPRRRLNRTAPWSAPTAATPTSPTRAPCT